MNPRLANLFGGQVSGGQGGMFIQQGGSPAHPGSVAGQFSGEADVMMISGVGAAEIATPGGATVAIPAQTFAGQLQLPITLTLPIVGVTTLPLWQWLTIAALLGGAGGFYLGRR